MKRWWRPDARETVSDIEHRLVAVTEKLERATIDLQQQVALTQLQQVTGRRRQYTERSTRERRG